MTFTITTTITTTVDPDNLGDPMSHEVRVDTDGAPDFFPEHLVYGVAQAACEDTIEHLMDFGIGTEGEIVEDEPSPFSVAGTATYDPESDVLDVEWTEHVA